jgi:hypothetical protein
MGPAILVRQNRLPTPDEDCVVISRTTPIAENNNRHAMQSDRHRHAVRRRYFLTEAICVGLFDHHSQADRGNASKRRPKLKPPRFCCSEFTPWCRPKNLATAGPYSGGKRHSTFERSCATVAIPHFRFSKKHVIDRLGLR